MYVIKSSLLNIKRQGIKSLLSSIISFFLLLFLFLYIGNIRGNEIALDQLQETVRVDGYITSPNGSLVSGLEIKRTTLDKIEQSDYTDEVHYISRLAADLLDSIGAEDGMKEIMVAAVNRLEALSSVPADTITWSEGMSPDFLLGSEPWCIASQEYMERNHLKIGDFINLDVYYYEYQKPNVWFLYQPLGKHTLKIVGSIPFWQQDNGNIPDLICPAGWSRQAYDKAGVEYFVDELSFVITQPLHLNEFKEQMRRVPLMSVNVKSDPSPVGFGLVINDEVFVRSADQLVENIDAMKNLLPGIFILIVFIGLISSYLFMQNRRKEVALMRALGTSIRGCYAIMISESILLTSFGSLPGMMLGLYYTTINTMEGAVLVTICFLCYTLGAVIAVGIICKVSVMEMLSDAQ